MRRIIKRRRQPFREVSCPTLAAYSFTAPVIDET